MLQYQLLRADQGGRLFCRRDLSPSFLTTVNLQDSPWLCKLTC